MPSRKEKNRDRMKLRRSLSYTEYQRALLIRTFSGLVDVIDFKRNQLPPQDRSKSQTLDTLYRRADTLLLRLRRLGGL